MDYCTNAKKKKKKARVSPLTHTRALGRRLLLTWFSVSVVEWENKQKTPQHSFLESANDAKM